MKEENEIFKAGFQAGLRDGKPGTPPIHSDPAGEELDLYKKVVYRSDAEIMEVIEAAKDILPLANIWGREWFNQLDWAKLDRFKKAVEAIK